MNESDIDLVEGSGNVFRDFGDPNADLKQAKAILAARIISILDEQGLTVRKAAASTGFAAADFSRIRNANLGRFTLDRMMRIVAALDDRLRVTVQVNHARPYSPIFMSPGEDLRQIRSPWSVFLLRRPIRPYGGGALRHAPGRSPMKPQARVRARGRSHPAIPSFDARQATLAVIVVIIVGVVARRPDNGS